MINEKSVNIIIKVHKSPELSARVIRNISSCPHADNSVHFIDNSVHFIKSSYPHEDNSIHIIDNSVESSYPHADKSNGLSRLGKVNEFRVVRFA